MGGRVRSGIAEKHWTIALTLAAARRQRADERYIRSTVMYGFADLVRSRGEDPASILSEAGLDASCLTDADQLISWRRLGLALEMAAERTSLPSFALAWSATIPSHFPNMGPILLLGSFTETFGEWFELGIRYWRLHTNAYSLQMLVNDDQATIRYWMDGSQFNTRQLMELSVANGVQLARRGTGVDADPIVVRFRHAAPPDTTPHAAAFRSKVEFEAEHDEVVIARHLLDAPSGGRLRSLKGVVGRYIRHRISQMPIYDQTMRSTVALAIPSVIGTGSCNLDFVANSLGLSPKKMQRLLQQEGTSFSEVLETVRQDLARRMVSESSAPIGRVAGLLDYSTSPPFTLAFRRWTGKSPREFRKKRD